MTLFSLQVILRCKLSTPLIYRTKTTFSTCCLPYSSIIHLQSLNVQHSWRQVNKLNYSPQIWISNCVILSKWKSSQKLFGSPLLTNLWPPSVLTSSCITNSTYRLPSTTNWSPICHHCTTNTNTVSLESGRCSQDLSRNSSITLHLVHHRHGRLLCRHHSRHSSHKIVVT